MQASLPERIARLFSGLLPAPPTPPPRPRVDHLPFSLHVFTGGNAVELFPAGPLDVLRLHQRHHGSDHELEYVVCLPEGATAEDFRAYALLRLRPETAVPLPDPGDVERSLRRSYGSLVRLPRARPLLERPYSDDLRDGDPPEGLNRVVAPPGEPRSREHFSTAEVLEIMRRELSGPEAIAWLETAFRHPPRPGRAEHRYYLDARAQLYLVRDEGARRTLYRAVPSDAALKPLRR